MQEQLISFETAKLAKEKGFEFQDWYEDYKYDFYCISEFVNDWRDSVNHYKVGDEIEGYYLNPLTRGKQDVVIYRPTQSLLQKWLREIHSIYVETTRHIGINDGSYIYYESSVQHNNKYKKLICPSKENYEEALEIGLQEALKLIKIN